MEALWSQYSLQILITIGLLAVIFIYTWLRDLVDSPNQANNASAKHQEKQMPDSSNADGFWDNTLENSPEPKVDVKKTTKKTFKGVSLGFGKESSGKTRIITSKQIRIPLTGDMIEALQNLDGANFITRMLVKKFVPDNLLDELVAKAMNNQLEAGMTLEIKNGEIHLTRNPSS